MSINITAIFENGVLRPSHPLELAEGTEVRLTISAPVSRDQAEVERSLYAELQRLAALKPNWDGYGSPALDSGILEAARRFVSRVADRIATTPLVVPMSSGALQFEWHNGPRVLELEVEDPTTIHYLKWDPNEGLQEEDVFAIDDREKAIALIGWFAQAGSYV